MLGEADSPTARRSPGHAIANPRLPVSRDNHRRQVTEREAPALSLAGAAALRPVAAVKRGRTPRRLTASAPMLLLPSRAVPSRWSQSTFSPFDLLVCPLEHDNPCLLLFSREVNELLRGLTPGLTQVTGKCAFTLTGPRSQHGRAAVVTSQVVVVSQSLPRPQRPGWEQKERMS